MTWVIWYDDGSTFAADPFDAPALGVQCIVQTDENPANGLGRMLCAGFDYYWFDGEWYGSDLFGLFDYLQRPGPRKVIFGRTIATAEHQRIRDTALTTWDGAT